MMKKSKRPNRKPAAELTPVDLDMAMFDLDELVAEDAAQQEEADFWAAVADQFEAMNDAEAVLMHERPMAEVAA